MVDTHALGACAARRGGSTPFIRTNFKYDLMVSTPFSTPFL